MLALARLNKTCVEEHNMSYLYSRTISLKKLILAIFIPIHFVGTGLTLTKNDCLYMTRGKNAFHLNPDNPNLFRVKVHPEQWNEKNLRDGSIQLYFKDKKSWLKVPTNNIMMIDTIHHEIVLLIKS